MPTRKHPAASLRRTFRDANGPIRPLSSLGVRRAGSTCILSFVMSWFAWLGLAVLITAVAAITGIKPKGTRHVAHTRLMGAARLVLLAIVIIFAYLAFRARSGG
jgi:hypothetical protein